MMDKEMCHGKWHLSCCFKPLLGKVLWAFSVVSLIMAWTASTKKDGLFCLQARNAEGACPERGLPVAHLFLDSLALGVLALGVSVSRCSNCGGCGRCAGDHCCGAEDEK